MEKIRPFLKWAGNKYNCLEKIIKHLPKGNRLIEPFTGSGAIFLNSQYNEYLLGELNHDLVNIFQQIQNNSDKFIEISKKLFTKANNRESIYYKFRDEFNSCKPGERRSALFLYLNRHGYNGLCRYNSKGIFNVPFGNFTNPIFPEERMQFFHKKSQKAKFVSQNFEKTFAEAQIGDVIYCDPPYSPISENAKGFTQYSGNIFDENTQNTLAKLAEETANRGIPVVISNHDTQFTRNLYKNGEIVSFNVPRYISANIYNRKPVAELICVYSPDHV